MTPRLACQARDPELFYGPADSGPGEALHAWEWAAMEVCWGCPVEAECLAGALSWPIQDQHGVIGGMAAQQRRATLIRRNSPPKRTTLPELPDLGELPPEVDPRAVAELAAGRRMPGATWHDRAYAAVALHLQGRSTMSIAVQLGGRDKQIYRWVTRHQEFGTPLQGSGPPRRAAA
jgi:hypothetical protein